MKDTTDRFRFDHAYNRVYEYSDQAKAYKFCGYLNGKTEAQFVREYEYNEEKESRE